MKNTVSKPFKVSVTVGILALENLPVFPDYPQGRYFTFDYEDLVVLHYYFNSNFISI